MLLITKHNHYSILIICVINQKNNFLQLILQLKFNNININLYIQ